MRYKLKVHPNSNEEKIEKLSENELEIYTKAPPEHNKANIAIINALSKYFNTSYKNIILKGLKSKNKTVEVKR
jgi:uncharacterized protein (TIGR00251 family)